jgi:hypothetical protein
MLFKMLKGDSSRISLDITPFHDGWCYYTTDDGKLYIDSEDGGKQKRTCINPISGGASRAVSGTLTKNGWVSGRQTLLVAGLQENQNGVIGIAQEVTDSQMEAAKGAELYVCNQVDGALTVACFGDVPQFDIPVVTILLA